MINNSFPIQDCLDRLNEQISTPTNHLSTVAVPEKSSYDFLLNIFDS